MSENAKHRIFTVLLYLGIFLIIVYFFNIIMETNKKIIYTPKEQLKLELIDKAVILEGDKKMLLETKSGQLLIVEGLTKEELERNNISYTHENTTVDEITKYALGAALLAFVVLLAIT